MIKCAPGYHSELNTKTGCNQCVKDNCPQIRCKSGYHLEIDPKTGCQKCVEDVPCTLIACAPGFHPLLDENGCTIKCLPDCPIPICLEGYHEIVNPDTGCINCEKDVDPATCPLIRCGSGTHPFYNPDTKSCACNPDNGKEICLTATTCLVGSTATWNPVTETCACVPNTTVKRAEPAVDPATCPTIKCTSTTHPVYHPDTKRCSCEPNEPVCPNAIFCAAGAHKVLKGKKCICQLDNPVPATCPKFKCLEKTHVVYNPDTKKCGCVPDCPDLFCIAEKTPVYDSTSNTCACQWIPGLEPTPVVTPTSPCADILCIAEKTPVPNPETNTCSCEWIPGLEPSSSVKRALPTPSRKNPCKDILCIAEKQPVANYTTNTCSCEVSQLILPLPTNFTPSCAEVTLHANLPQWIPGFGPTIVKAREAAAEPVRIPWDPCREVLCLPNMRPYHNITSGECGCEKFPADEFKRTVPVTSCASIKCISEQHGALDPVTGKCTCVWIDGFGPITS